MNSQIKITIKKGDRVFIKPEWQDAGDDKKEWYCVKDSDDKMLGISAKSDLPFPPWQWVDVEMIEPAHVAIAREFSKLMLEEIGADNLALVVAQNTTDIAQGNDSTCSTHDYCDANMVMDQAFQNILKRGNYMIEDDATDAQRDADTDLWNAAWTLSKHNQFNPEKIN